MKNLLTRQKYLLDEWGFKCSCTLCLDETKTDANAKYEQFAELRREQEEEFEDPRCFLSFQITLYVLLETYFLYT